MKTTTTSNARLTLSLQELREIASKPHSSELKIAALQIYPNARKFRIRATMFAHGQSDSIDMVGDEKWVDGAYIVSTFQVPGYDDLRHMIVTHDDEHHCYRKWVITSKVIEQSAIGTRVGDSRTISWVFLPTKGESSDKLVLGQEVHNDTSTEWTSLHLEGDTIIARETGEAVSAE